MAAGTTDMANGGNGFVNEEARFAALSQRVTGIESSVNNLSNQFASFVAKLDERGRTPWGLIVSAAVAILAYVTTIGGLAYAPVWSAISKQELSQQATVASISKLADNTQAAFDAMTVKIAALAEKTVSQKELEWRTARSAEDRARTDAAVADLRSNQVPRQELERVWQSEDQQKAQLQKQIDELKQNQANTYSARDVILDMRERLDRIERQRIAAPGG